MRMQTEAMDQPSVPVSLPFAQRHSADWIFGAMLHDLDSSTTSVHSGNGHLSLVALSCGDRKALEVSQSLIFQAALSAVSLGGHSIFFTGIRFSELPRKINGARSPPKLRALKRMKLMYGDAVGEVLRTIVSESNKQIDGPYVICIDDLIRYCKKYQVARVRTIFAAITCEIVDRRRNDIPLLHDKCKIFRLRLFICVTESVEP